MAEAWAWPVADGPQSECGLRRGLGLLQQIWERRQSQYCSSPSVFCGAALLEAASLLGLAEHQVVAGFGTAHCAGSRAAWACAEQRLADPADAANPPKLLQSPLAAPHAHTAAKV